MTPRERRDMPWIIGIAVVVMLAGVLSGLAFGLR
jgi:hypothetical protein